MLEPLTIANKEKIISKIFYIDKYDELCEDHFKIEKIVPLKQPTWKFILDLFLSLTLIKFYLYGFSNKLIKFMKYEECTLDNAEILGVYCYDGKLYLIELKKIVLPNVKNPDILTSQLNYSRECYLFTFKLFTYIFNPNTNSFNSIKYSIFHTKEDVYQYMSKGLTKEEKQYQQYIYGECDLFFKINSFFRELFLNTCNYFFLFQVYSIALWYFQKYYSYASVITSLTLFDLFEETYTSLKNLKNIRKMARYSIKVKIYEKLNNNNFNIFEKNSTDLVPGDIFELPGDGDAMPCDCILLSGSVIINEAMLTGESTPIIKSHLPNNKQIFDEETDMKYFLFAGTKIVQKRPENKKPIIALCYSTGFNSVKGNLIRSILYPVEGENKFEKESMKFILFMAILCVIGYFAVLPFKIKKINNETYDSEEEKKQDYIELVLQGLDLITTAIPPTLPCCLGIGIGIAQKRFKKKNITCINRNKITPAGKVTVCVFDKTGTLTEDHLTIAGFLPVEAFNKNTEDNFNFSHNIFAFDQFYQSIKEISNENFNYYKEKKNNPKKKSKKKELLQLYIECLACCQGITRVEGKLIGDPIDVEMFESTGWNLIEEPNDPQNYDPRILTFVRPSQEKSLTEKLKNQILIDKNNNDIINDEFIDHYEIAIIRRFDFSSKLQRMSTLVKNMVDTNYLCFCKGSPEKIRELCMEKTIPENFNEELNSYTSQGYRVLALASKVIQMDFSEALEISRSSCEKDLIFLGLLIVQNKLKEATNDTLKVLSEKANIKVRMATGDNIMTAICVARKSNLINPLDIVYNCEIEKEESENKNIDMRKKSMNLYDNNLLKEKEKEKIKKKLVWKTIENFKEDEDEDMMKKTKKIKHINTISIDQNLSCLVPIEVGEDDMGEEEDGNALIKTKNDEKKNNQENEFDENIYIDLSSLPFDKNNDEDNIQIALTGKTFETLYHMNQKYEEFINKNKEIYPKEIDSIQPFNNLGDEIGFNDDINNENNNNINGKYEFKNEDINKFITYKQFHEAFRLVLKNCSIYARCSPENKTQIVQSLQKECFTVLMCGDGANDCGALKVADVGISLSTEEASIAAPFTSSIPDISCVIEVLKEGKCSLVTSFQIFKYILLYSLIQFISVTILLLNDSYLADWQFMAEDLFLITPLAFLMPLTPAYDKLTYHRPVSSLFSFNIISSILLQTMCVGAFQVGSYFFMDFVFPDELTEANKKEFEDIFCENDKNKKPFTNFEECPYNFRTCDTDIEKNNINCLDNTSNFYLSFAQLLIICIVFAKGKPFKKSIFHNILLFLFCTIMFLYSEYIIFYVDYFSNNYMKIVPFPDDTFFYNSTIHAKYYIQFKYYLMIIVVLNFIVSLIIEKVIIPKTNKCWRKRRMNSLKYRIDNNKEREENLNMINNVKNYIKEQKMKKKKNNSE